MEEIIITIDKVGRPKVDAVGFQGTGCSKATKPIIDALTNASSQVKTDEKCEMHMGMDQTQEAHEYI